MEIILLERIENVGGIGERVKVKSGFARNYLIPKGKATLATAENIARFEKIRAELEAKAAAEHDAAKARAAKIEGQEIRIVVQSGSEGRLFGSVGTMDIAEALAPFGADIERSEVRLPDGPLRVLGEHDIEIHLHTDVNVPLKVVLEPSEPIEAPVDSDDDAEGNDDEDRDDD